MRRQRSVDITQACRTSRAKIVAIDSARCTSNKPQLSEQTSSPLAQRSSDSTAHHKTALRSKMAYGAVADEAATLTTPIQVRSESADSIHVGFQSRRGSSVVAAAVAIADAVTGVDRQQPLVRRASQRAFRVHLWLDLLAQMSAYGSSSLTFGRRRAGAAAPRPRCADACGTRTRPRSVPIPL